MAPRCQACGVIFDGYLPGQIFCEDCYLEALHDNDEDIIKAQKDANEASEYYFYFYFLHFPHIHIRIHIQIHIYLFYCIFSFFRTDSFHAHHSCYVQFVIS
jgi:hypothetical protein